MSKEFCSHLVLKSLNILYSTHFSVSSEKSNFEICFAWILSFSCNILFLVNQMFLINFQFQVSRIKFTHLKTQLNYFRISQAQKSILFEEKFWKSDFPQYGRESSGLHFLFGLNLGFSIPIRDVEKMVEGARTSRLWVKSTPGCWWLGIFEQSENHLTFCL